MNLNMKLYCKFILLIFYLAPVWCRLNRMKRTTTQHYPPKEVSDSHYHQGIENILSILCQPNGKIPFFKRSHERVVAFNEQVMPQFMYPYENSYHPNHDHPYTHYEGHLSNPTQFPSQGFDDTRIYQPNTNNINKQHINHKDKGYPTQIQKPPTHYGDRHPPSWHYPRPYPHQHNEGVANVDSGINISVNSGSENNNIAKESLSRQEGSPYNHFNNPHPYPSNLNYKSLPYANSQDVGYSESSLYPRSTSYLGEPDFSTKPMYSPFDPYYGPPNNPSPQYIIDPEVLSVFDEYIQSKIDASHNKNKQNEQNVTINSNTNQTSST